MELNGNPPTLSSTSLFFLTFFEQKGCQSIDLKRELRDLTIELEQPLGEDDDYFESDGKLQTDGYSAQCDIGLRGLSADFQHLVQPKLPGDVADLQAVRDVAAALVQIADRFDNAAVARAAEQLTSKLNNSVLQNWGAILSEEINRLLTQGPRFEQQSQENILMAVTFMLVKGACERSPALLRGLFTTTLQYFTQASLR